MLESLDGNKNLKPGGKNEANGAHLQLLRGYRKQILIRANEKDPIINGMSYNAARDELFFVDKANSLVRVARQGNNNIELRQVYRASEETGAIICDVCYIKVFDTLLVCLREFPIGLGRNIDCLLALNRNGDEWGVEDRVELYSIGSLALLKCCPLGATHIIAGQHYSFSLELYRINSQSRIEHLHRFLMPSFYFDFATRPGSGEFVATCFGHSVLVHRVSGDRLEAIARTQLDRPSKLLWLPERLLVSVIREKNSDSVIELDVVGTHIQRRSQIIFEIDLTVLSCWCAVGDGLALSAGVCPQEIMFYTFE